MRSLVCVVLLSAAVSVGCNAGDDERFGSGTSLGEATGNPSDSGSEATTSSEAETSGDDSDPSTSTSDDGGDGDGGSTTSTSTSSTSTSSTSDDGGDGDGDDTGSTTTSSTDGGDGDGDGAMEYCGDGIVNNGEQCDGVDLGLGSCIALGFTGGVLQCTAQCTFDTSGCEDGSCGMLFDPCDVDGDCCWDWCEFGQCQV